MWQCHFKYIPVAPHLYAYDKSCINMWFLYINVIVESESKKAPKIKIFRWLLNLKYILSDIPFSVTDLQMTSCTPLSIMNFISSAGLLGEIKNVEIFDHFYQVFKKLLFPYHLNLTLTRKSWLFCFDCMAHAGSSQYQTQHVPMKRHLGLLMEAGGCVPILFLNSWLAQVNLTCAITGERTSKHTLCVNPLSLISDKKGSLF